MTDASDGDVFLSVVIPAFDETGRIGATVGAVCSYLDSRPEGWELIVVLDGGRPGALEEIASAACGRPNVRVLDNHVNRGKGFSVRRGILAALGRYRAFIDADLSLPIDGTEMLVGALERGADVAIGSRTVEGSRVTGDRARFRQTMGRVFNVMVRLLAVPGIRDTQCGFKGFRGDVANRIFGLSRLDRFGFDVEVLRIAQRLRYRIVELPVVCTYRRGSSVRHVRDAASMLIDLLRIRCYEITGRYDQF